MCDLAAVTAEVDAVGGVFLEAEGEGVIDAVGIAEGGEMAAEVCGFWGGAGGAEGAVFVIGDSDGGHGVFSGTGASSGYKFFHFRIGCRFPDVMGNGVIAFNDACDGELFGPGVHAGDAKAFFLEGAVDGGIGGGNILKVGWRKGDGAALGFSDVAVGLYAAS